MKSYETMNDYQRLRNQMTDTICFSVFLSVGANFIVTGISQNMKLYIFCGIGIIISIISIWAITNLKYLNKYIMIEGVFLYNKTKNSFEIIPDYKISEDMNRFFKSACTENKAIEKNIKGKNLVDYKIKNNKSFIINTKHEPMKIVHELIEYCLLQKLMTALTDFNNKTGSKDIVFYSRDKFLPLLSKNRFLSLFTEPMKNRENFCDSKMGDNVVAAYSNGCSYEKFLIYLPKKSEIEKIKNSVIIKTKAANLVIETDFNGCNAYINPLFKEAYLSKTNYCEYHFNVTINLKWKIISLLNRRLKKNYAWIDSYINKITHYSDFNIFLEDINWNNIQANLLIQKNNAKVKNKKKIK